MPSHVMPSTDTSTQVQSHMTSNVEAAEIEQPVSVLSNPCVDTTTSTAHKKQVTEAEDEQQRFPDVVVSPQRTEDQSPYAVWRRLGSPRFIASPMVDQSELAFRILTRRYGVQLAYTPMLHARVFVNDATYRRKFFFSQLIQVANGEQGRPKKNIDRPLIVQFAGNDADTLIAAARQVSGYVDAVDLNLGCPERIAKKGHYGSFLLDEPERVVSIVGKMCKALQPLNLPVFCKIRIMLTGHHIPEHRRGLPGTISFCRQLQAVGCAALCVHGRHRANKGPKTIGADWAAIAAIKKAVSIPVIANGGVETSDDVVRCLRETGCDAVMSAEALLGNPTLFSSLQDLYRPETNTEPSVVPPHSLARSLDNPTPLQLSLQYIKLCEQYPPPDFFKSVKLHLFRLLHAILHQEVGTKLSNAIQAARTVADCRQSIEKAVADGLDTTAPFVNLIPQSETLTQAQREAVWRSLQFSSWYRRHRRVRIV